MNDKLMLGLGSWAAINIAGSGVGWALSENAETRNFHQMNVMWNSVNLGLALAGKLQANNANSNLGLFESIEAQRKTETVFLINGGLDLVYIASGVVLKYEANFNADKEDLYKGFGNSLLIQGGFLLVFDWIAYTIHRKHARKELSPLLKRIEISDEGVGVKIRID